MGQKVSDLDACLAGAADQAARDDCIAKFKAAPGNKQKGGKVFSDSAGGEIATSQDGGKVFVPKA